MTVHCLAKFTWKGMFVCALHVLQKRNNCLHILLLAHEGCPCGDVGDLRTEECVCFNQQGAVELQLSPLLFEWGRSISPLVSLPLKTSLTGMSEHNQRSVLTFEMNSSWPLIIVHQHAAGWWNMCTCVNMCNNLTHLQREVAMAQVSHTPECLYRLWDVHKWPPVSGSLWDFYPRHMWDTILALLSQSV